MILMQGNMTRSLNGICCELFVFCNFTGYKGNFRKRFLGYLDLY